MKNFYRGSGRPKDKKEEVIDMLKGMSTEEIAAIMQAINK